MADRDSWGHALERAALAYILQFPEYRCLRENYTARTGEIDLIFEYHPQHERTEYRPRGHADRRSSRTSRANRRIELVFVEVKGRRGWRNGLESVDWGKRRRVELTARRFLASYRGPAEAVRFDVIVWERGQWVWFRDAWREDASRRR